MTITAIQRRGQPIISPSDHALQRYASPVLAGSPSFPSAATQPRPVPEHPTRPERRKELPPSPEGTKAFGRGSKPGNMSLLFPSPEGGERIWSCIPAHPPHESPELVTLFGPRPPTDEHSQDPSHKPWKHGWQSPVRVLRRQDRRILLGINQGFN